MVVIAISGPPGVGSTTVAQKVAKKLGLRFFSPGQTFKSYSKEGKEAKAALEVWQTEWGRSKELHSRLEEEQVRIAKQGDVVVCGKLSIHFLRGIADLRVWLDAPLSVRAQRVAKRDGISVEEACKQLEQREKLERERFKQLYGFDYFEQGKEADLVIDTVGLSANEVVKRIVESCF